MSQLNVAVIGAGKKGRHHIGVLNDFEDVNLMALCDPVANSLNSAADEFNVTHRFFGVQEMLDTVNLDAVFIATPPHLNAPVAQTCVAFGVPTFLEKPAGMNVDEAKKLRDVVAATGVKTMVGLNRRFHPIIRKAREMVEERGPIVQMVGEFHKSMAGIIARNQFIPEVIDNFLMANDIHAVDVVRSMAGAEVKQVHSIGRRTYSEYRDMHSALVLFENNCVAQFTFNYTTDKRLERYEIHGNGISAYLEGVNQGVVYCDGTSHDLSSEGGGSGGTEEENRYFLDCIREDRPIELPAANMDEAVKSAELVDAIRAGFIEE